MKTTNRPIPWRCFYSFILPVLVAGMVIPTSAQSLLGGQDLSAVPYLDLYRKGEYRKALEAVQKEIDSRPELAASKAFRYVYWLSGRADIFFQLGKLDEAIHDLKVCVEVFPEPQFVYRLASLYRYGGRMEEYENLIAQSSSLRQTRGSFYPYEWNLLALARIAEWRGQNPKQLLSSIYASLMENAPNFAGGFIGAGDLAFRRGAYDLASNYYEKAVTLDDQDQEALAGLAETYWKSNDPRLEETLKKLLALNPHHFRAKAIQSELLIDQNQPQEALDLLKEPLELNPHQLRLRALQAASYFLLDATGSCQTVRRLVLDFNPHCSEIDQIPGRIASRHYRFAEGIEFQHNALQTNPDDVEARTQYGLDLLRLGKDAEGKRELEKAFADDPYNVEVYNLLNLLDSLQSFDTLEQGPFLLQFPHPETPVWSDEALALLQEEWQTYQAKYEITLQTPIHVQVFDDHDDFMVRSVGLPGAIEFMGICFGHLITMDSPTARTRHSMNWQSVLWHEFVHVVTLQKTNHRMPRWLSEGISVYEETQKSSAWGQKMQPQYKSIIEYGDLPGVSNLENYFIHPKTPNHMMLGYFLSSEFVRFYVAQYGIHSLVESLSQIGNGKSVVPSLAEAASRSVPDLDKAFRAYLKTRLAPYQNLPPVHDDSNLMEKLFKGDSESLSPPRVWLDQPSPFTDALRAAKEAETQNQWDKAANEYEEAFQLYPDYTGADAPLIRLTAVYEKADQKDKLRETLWRRVNWDGEDFDACQQLIMLHLQEEDWKKAAEAARRALAIDPFHVDSRRALMLAYSQMDRNPEALEQAGKLIQLDPSRRIDYQLERIQTLLRLNEKARAKKDTILLLEEFPHLWKAQQMLLTLTEGEERKN